AVHDGRGLVDGAACLKLENAEVDQRRQKAVLPIELDTYPPADRSQVPRTEHRLLVFRQKASMKESGLMNPRSPADKQFAEPDEEHDVHRVLNRERIREVSRTVVQDQ